MPAKAVRHSSDATTDRPLASSSSTSAPASMLQRGPVRERNVEDEIELVENGTHPLNGGAREEKTGLVSGIVGERSVEADIEGGALSTRDKRALALLVALCTSYREAKFHPSVLTLSLLIADLLQGIPVGLAFGSIPFLLRAKLSYSQIGIFTLCTYPYSLKLLWSPIVDSIFSPKLGRRKSWIVPIQTIVGVLFWWLGNNVQQMMEVVREEPVGQKAADS